VNVDVVRDARDGWQTGIADRQSPGCGRIGIIGYGGANERGLPVSIVVETTSGQVGGEQRDGLVAFLGVPYAAAPVGALRYAKPEPHPAWEGVRDATRAGPTAPYGTRPFPGLHVAPLIGEGWVKGDDYLAANIWTPGPKAKGLPVMVWIHGGGFVVGTKDAAINDGTQFARSGVVCIGINYRLGLNGFLPIPGVPTNLGLRDQIAALEWVQQNAAAFGGDPANVTVFGESAGAMSIADLVTSPLTKGLFRRAIIQSGHGGMTREVGIARRVVEKLARRLKVTPDAAGYATVSDEDAIKAVEIANNPKFRVDLRDGEGREPVFGISKFVPVHGDDVLPEPPHEALAKGAGAEVDVLIGSNSEEMNLYLVPTGMRARIGKLLAWFALSRSIPRARQILKAYGMGSGKKPGYVFADATTDLVFRWPARRFAEEHRGRTHVYEFEWRSPAAGGELGAAHGMEIPFVFDTLACATGPEGLVGENPPQELATRTHKLWVDFARDGSLPWPPFDRNTRMVYKIAQGEAAFEAPMPSAPFQP
jgi:para-nitrobenzyl esterase